jgi:hypothetical protein
LREKLRAEWELDGTTERRPRKSILFLQGLLLPFSGKISRI